MLAGKTAAAFGGAANQQAQTERDDQKNKAQEIWVCLQFDNTGVEEFIHQHTPRKELDL